MLSLEWTRYQTRKQSIALNLCWAWIKAGTSIKHSTEPLLCQSWRTKQYWTHVEPVLDLVQKKTPQHWTQFVPGTCKKAQHWIQLKKRRRKKKTYCDLLSALLSFFATNPCLLSFGCKFCMVVYTLVYSRCLYGVGGGGGHVHVWNSLWTRFCAIKTSILCYYYYYYYYYQTILSQDQTWPKNKAQHWTHVAAGLNQAQEQSTALNPYCA